MTGTGDGRGGGRQRGGPPTRERGTDRYQPRRPAEPADAKGWASGATIEELSTVRLPPTPLRRTRLGASGMVAVLAIVALLAVGFGALGGRPDPSPSPVLGGVASLEPAEPSGPAPTPDIAPGQTPQVTPYSSCGESPASRPDVQLQVDGRPVNGVVELLDHLLPVATDPNPAPTPQAIPDRISVPIDVISELWVVGGACAVAWQIDLDDRDQLEARDNPRLDPFVAAQNRFALTLAPFAGQDRTLRASLVFPRLTARATWPIRIEPFDRPVAKLRINDELGDLVEGCDVMIRLGTGYEFPTPEGCVDQLPGEPEFLIKLDRDDVLTLEIDGWTVTNGIAQCGHLSGLSFVVDESSCFVEGTPEGDALTYNLPIDLVGEWTLALAACAQSRDSIRGNSACATWYANVAIQR